ncbi:MAG: VWA domain-containing protein [Planctomycetes bacterium]|nr:VWA domain-containing protein [Planctomycetota bacterium]
MQLDFSYPWLVMLAALTAIGALLPWIARRRGAPALFTLAAAGFILAAAGPRFAAAGDETLHLLVVDVSDSMASRVSSTDPWVAAQLAGASLPRGHRLEVAQLSDALRAKDAPTGGPTNLGAMAAAAGWKGVNGEVVLVTDGRGELADLSQALPARRVILLPAPTPQAPDAAVAAVSAPSWLAPLTSGQLTATLVSDRDLEVPWRLLEGDREIRSGRVFVPAGLGARVSTAIPALQPGSVRFRFRVDLPADREPRNDQAEFTVLVGGQRIVEYARDSRVPETADSLLAMLRADARNQVRVRANLPSSDAELDGVGLLVVNDLSLSGSGLDASQLGAITRYVRAGGSLLMAGADGAFAPGGYRGTLLEDVMPVRFRPDDEPPRHLLMLLDTSSSMAERTDGGAVKLDLLQQGARLAAAAMHGTDRVAIAGFHARLRNDPVFEPASNVSAREAALSLLKAEGRTLIRQSLEQAVSVMAPLASPEIKQRILLVTDGEEGEPVDEAAWRALAARLAALNLALDVVLTEQGLPAWLQALRDAPAKGELSIVTVGDRGFDDLLDALSKAMAAQEQGLVVRGELTVDGARARLPVVSRTSARKGEQIRVLAACLDPPCPVFATRDLLGRTGVICTATAGGAAVAEFWADPSVVALTQGLLAFLLENAGQPRLTLLPTSDGRAELTWIAAGTPPAGDLRTGSGQVASRVGFGRWRLDALPPEATMEVFSGDQLLVRLPLPRVASAELARTGNDPVFFEQAEAAGFRVLSGLAAWRPARWEPATEQFSLRWVCAAMGLVAMLAGFAVHRRRA